MSSETAITIRLAEREDLPSVLALYRELSLGESKSLSITSAEALFDKISRYPDYQMYVAVQDNVIIGTFTLMMMDNLAHAGAPSAIVEDVAVHADWQGKGVGNQMMQFVMAVSREKGAYKLVLSSHVKREAAHRFYEKLGFDRYGYSFGIQP